MKNSITLHFIIFFVACGGNDSDKSLGKRSDFPDQESWNPVIVMTREAKKRAIVRSNHLAKFSDKQEIILNGNVDVDFFSDDENILFQLRILLPLR